MQRTRIFRPKNVAAALICVLAFISLNAAAVRPSKGCGDDLRAELREAFFGSPELARLVSTRPQTRTVDQLLAEKRFQEAAWMLRQEGQAARAEAIEDMLLRVLKTGKYVGFHPSSDPSVEIVEFENGIIAVHKLLAANEGKGDARAYILDRALKNRAHVPVSVFRDDDDFSGSLQVRVPGIANDRVKLPEEVVLEDLISGNFDRAPGHNILYTPAGMHVSIDNEHAFSTEYDDVSEQQMDFEIQRALSEEPFISGSRLLRLANAVDEKILQNALSSGGIDPRPAIRRLRLLRASPHLRISN